VLSSTHGGASCITLTGDHQATSYTTTVATTGSVRFGIVGMDTLSTSGATTRTATFSPRLVQQSSSAVSWGGTWKKATGPSWSGGSAKYASTRGRSATYKVTGRAVALVALKAPTRGKLKIYVGGTYQTTIDLSKVSAAAYRTVVWQTTWSTVRTRTIKVVVVGTGSHPRVDVDAFVAFK